jgi:hypothetical protein
MFASIKSRKVRVCRIVEWTFPSEKIHSIFPFGNIEWTNKMGIEVRRKLVGAEEH